MNSRLCPVGRNARCCHPSAGTVPHGEHQQTAGNPGQQAAPIAPSRQHAPGKLCRIAPRTPSVTSQCRVARCLRLMVAMTSSITPPGLHNAHAAQADAPHAGPAQPGKDGDAFSTILDTVVPAKVAASAAPPAAAVAVAPDAGPLDGDKGAIAAALVKPKAAGLASPSAAGDASAIPDDATASQAATPAVPSDADPVLPLAVPGAAPPANPLVAGQVSATPGTPAGATIAGSAQLGALAVSAPAEAVAVPTGRPAMPVIAGRKLATTAAQADTKANPVTGPAPAILAQAPHAAAVAPSTVPRSANAPVIAELRIETAAAAPAGIPLPPMAPALLDDVLPSPSVAGPTAAPSPDAAASPGDAAHRCAGCAARRRAVTAGGGDAGARVRHGRAPPAPGRGGARALAQTGSGSTVTLRLDPGELGHVQVRIERDADGTATVHVAADRADTLRCWLPTRARCTGLWTAPGCRRTAGR